MSRLSSDLYETGSARSLPLSSRRSPSYLSHRSVENDLINPYGSTKTFTRTLSHSGVDYHPTSPASSTSAAISRTLPLRRSLKTFDRGPQSILPEYDTTPLSSTVSAGGLGSTGRHSLLDSKYEPPSSYLTRLRTASKERHSQHPDREGSVSRVRTLYTRNQSSGEANGWEGGQDAVSNTMLSLTASSLTSSPPTTIAGNSLSSSMSTGISLGCDSSVLSPNSSFSFPIDHNHGDSPSRLLSVQEKMNNYSQYYQSLTQSPYRRLPLASPSQIHANSSPPSQLTFGVGLSELKNNSSQVPVSSSLSRSTAFCPEQLVPSSTILPLKVDESAVDGGVASSTSDDGSATPCIQSPVSNTLSTVTSPSVSPPQIPSPVNKLEISPKSAEELRAAAKPPVSSSTASSIPRWPAVSVRQHRPLSISSFPDGPRASSVSRVMSPPPIQSENVQSNFMPVGNGIVAETLSQTSSVAANVQKRRDSRATSVERITRLLERKSMTREVSSGTTNTCSNSVTTVGSEASTKKIDDTAVKGDPSTNGEGEKPSNVSKKPKFLQNLEKKWEKLTHSGSGSSTSINKGDRDGGSAKQVEACPAIPTPSSPEPHQAGGTSEESTSSNEDKINESVLLRRALSPEKKANKFPSSRLGSSGGTVGFMLGKFKRMEETPSLNSSMSKIPTGRPPVAAPVVNNLLSSRLGRRVQMPYGGTTSDSVLTLTAAAKEIGRGTSEEEGGLIKSAAVVAQAKRHLQTKVEVKKDIPSTQEGPIAVVAADPVITPDQDISPPQIQIQDDETGAKTCPETLPQMDMSSLSPISVSEMGEPENPPTKSDSGNITDDAESVSDRILRKSFYNRFNAGGIDRNRRSHSVTPGSSRRVMGSSNTSNNLRVNTAASNGVGGSKGPGTGSQQVRRSVSPAASTVASVDSKESSGSDQGSSQNRSPSPYWSGLNKYNPNPLFKELMIGEDFRSNEVGKKAEYSRRITSKLSKLLREIESDLNSCQLSKTGSDEGDCTGLLLENESGGIRPLRGNRLTSPANGSSIPHPPTPNGMPNN